MEKNTDFLEKLVHINRITKVVKGGRRFGFSALVVVGNQNGKIGIAHAKAKQVPDAIKKANELARRNLILVPLRQGRTIHHDIYGKDGAGKIKLRAAPKGTGIIAGGPVRAVCEVLGIKDIVAKSLGTANPHNVIRACLKALSKQSAMAFAAVVSIWSMFFPFNVGNNLYSSPQVTMLWVLIGFAVGLTHTKSEK